MKFKDFINDSSMKLLKDIKISENLSYHLENKIPLCENAFRAYSEAYFELINEVRNLYNKDLIAVNDDDAELLETDIGQVIENEGKIIYLDCPKPIKDKINEQEKKSPLNKPMRTPGGPKKFKVYVKTPNGNIKTVRFGDSKKSGLSIKNSSPARAKSFRARHKCSEKKDRTKAGYWACNIARYAKSVGLKSNSPW